MKEKLKIHLINKQNFMDALFFGLCCIMMILLLLRDVNGVDLSKWVFLILSIIVFAIFDMNFTAIFICFLIPFTVGLPYYYIFGAGLIIFILKNLNKLVLNKFIIPLIALFVVELLSFIYGNYSIGGFIRFAIPLFFISLVIFNDKNNFDCEKMLLYFLLAATGAELSVVLQSISINGLDSLISAGVRLGDTSKLLFKEGMRVSYNPNSLALLCALSTSILLVLLSRARHKLIILVLLVFQIFVGSMSLSRLFIVLLIIIALIYWLSLAKSIRRFFKGVALITILTIGVYTSINYYSPSLLASFSSRFAVEDISNGRLEIMALYFNVLEQHPGRIFFGVGLQDYQQKSGVFEQSHNGLQEVLITWGIVGLLLVALYIFGIYRYGWRGVIKKNRKIIYLLPLIVVLVGIQSGQFFYSGNSALYFLPIYATMRLAKNNG